MRLRRLVVQVGDDQDSIEIGVGGGLGHGEFGSGGLRTAELQIEDCRVLDDAGARGL